MIWYLEWRVSRHIRSWNSISLYMQDCPVAKVPLICLLEGNWQGLNSDGPCLKPIWSFLVQNAFSRLLRRRSLIIPGVVRVS